MRKRIPKILVTGGAGFIGSEFVRFLTRDCPLLSLAIVDKLTYAGDLERLKEIRNKIKFYKADICNKKQIEPIFKKERPKIVVHFAAETHVDRSIRDATPFIETNIRGTQMLLDTAMNYKTKRFLHVSCYDRLTRALTTDGLKTFKELKQGDKVFSLSPITREIEVKPIQKVIIQHYKGNMIYFNNKRINLLVTPNHRMYILNTSKKNKKLLIETAERASRRSIFYMPEGNWVGKEKEYSDVRAFGQVKTKELLYILGIFIGDGFIAYQEKHKETKTGLARKEYLNKSRDSRTGRFIKIEKSGNHISTLRSYRVFFDIPENDKCRERVEQTLSRLGINYHCHKGKAGTHLYFNSKAFMEVFARCGEGAYNKHIPRWALEYSREYLKYLFDGLMDSDGHNGVAFHTVSERLLSDFCELCIKLNLKPNIYKRHCISFIDGRKIEGYAYHISVGKTIKSISRHRHEIVEYNGKIWCVKLKDNKNLIVERNGKFNFCGNTDEIYGEIKKGSFSEDSPLKPNSPYAVSKAAADLLIKAYIRTYGFPAIIVRPCNNYGPWQYPEKLIPLVILKILRKEKIPVYANGKNTREWLFVSDCARGIFEIMKKGKIGEIYNLGSNDERQNIEVVKLILKNLQASRSMIQFVKDRPGHDIRYKLNSQKIFRQTGWKPKVKFEAGIKIAIQWCLEHRDWLLSKWEDIAELYK